MAYVPRSLLFTPGSRPDRFAKAGATAAEGLILDLEDAVAEADKDIARANVAAFLADRQGVAQQVTIRINPLSRPSGLRDLAMLATASAGPEYILLPKAETPEQILLMAQVLDDAGSAARIGALVESARGVAGAAGLAQAHERLAFLMFGAADYAANLGQLVGTFRPDHARAVIVNAAACGGVVAIDSPFFAIDCPDELEADCRAGKALGFHGKAAIHPSQIDPINHGYSPSYEERAQALRILEAAPDGVGVLDGKMVDIAMVRWAQRLA
ncbi:MAG: CoA ester lyase [Pigmentiphaga sp.]